MPQTRWAAERQARTRAAAIVNGSPTPCRPTFLPPVALTHRHTTRCQWCGVPVPQDAPVCGPWGERMPGLSFGRKGVTRTSKAFCSSPPSRTLKAGSPTGDIVVVSGRAQPIEASPDRCLNDTRTVVRHDPTRRATVTLWGQPPQGGAPSRYTGCRSCDGFGPFDQPVPDNHPEMVAS